MTPKIVLHRVSAVGDELTVVGTVNGEEVTASGHVSAMENYFPPDCYLAEPLTITDDDGIQHQVGSPGDLKPSSTPRAMTDDEKQVYWFSLLAPDVSGHPSDEPPVVFYDSEED